MKRTQLYLNDDIWKALHVASQQHGTSISELVRQALREKYTASSANRQNSMQAFVGLWKDRDDLLPSEAYIRKLRKGNRLRRIGA